MKDCLITCENLDIEKRAYVKIYRFWKANNRQESFVILTLKKEDKLYFESMPINGLDLILIKVPLNNYEEYEIKYQRKGLIESIEEMDDGYKYIVVIPRNPNVDILSYLCFYYAVFTAFEISENLPFTKKLQPLEEMEFRKTRRQDSLMGAEKIYSLTRKILKLEGVNLEKNFNELREKESQETNLENEIIEEQSKEEYLEFNLLKPFEASIKTNGYEFVVPKDTIINYPRTSELKNRIDWMINNGLLERKEKVQALIGIDTPLKYGDKLIVKQDIKETGISYALRVIMGITANKKYYEYFEDPNEIREFVETRRKSGRGAPKEKFKK